MFLYNILIYIIQIFRWLLKEQAFLFLVLDGWRCLLFLISGHFQDTFSCIQIAFQDCSKPETEIKVWKCKKKYNACWNILNCKASMQYFDWKIYLFWCHGNIFFHLLLLLFKHFSFSFCFGNAFQKLFSYTLLFIFGLKLE